MLLSIKKILLACSIIFSVSSSMVLATDDLNIIEENPTYKIKNEANSSYLSSSTSETYKSKTLIDMDTRDERANYRLWYFEKAGDFYKIKSKDCGRCLSRAFESDKHSAFTFMANDVQDGQENNRLWYFEKVGEFYKIKNKFSGTYLSSTFETVNTSGFLTPDEQEDKINYRLWYFEKVEELGKTKDKSTETCSDNCESEKGNYKKNIQEEQTKYKMLYVGGCGPCITPVNTYGTGQREGNLKAESSKFALFRTSFLDGAAYSLVPEVIRDAMASRGYPRASTIVSTIVQGGLIVYNSPSYIAPLTGMAVRIGCDQLGFSPHVSASIGSVVAVVAILSQQLLFSQETVLDSLMDVAIGVAGSYAGSILALKAKSWVYGLWTNPGMTIHSNN